MVTRRTKPASLTMPAKGKRLKRVNFGAEKDLFSSKWVRRFPYDDE